MHEVLKVSSPGAGVVLGDLLVEEGTEVSMLGADDVAPAPSLIPVSIPHDLRCALTRSVLWMTHDTDWDSQCPK